MQELVEHSVRGSAKKKNPQIRDYYGSGWVGPGPTRNFCVENSPKPVVIFVSSVPCVFCLYALLKVVGYCNLSVLSMSVMGFQKKFGWIWALPNFCLPFHATIQISITKCSSSISTLSLVARSNKVKSKSKPDDDGSEGLAELIPDIQKTAQIVDSAVGRLSGKSGESTDYMNVY